MVSAVVTRVYKIDPLQDVRWPRFLEMHPTATLFHSTEWLDALQLTYGYRASVLTTSPARGALDQWPGVLPGAELAHGTATGLGPILRPLYAID